MTPDTSTPLQPWGEESVHLNFAGLQYRIEGLASGQCAPISKRFELALEDVPPPEHAIVVKVGHARFEESDPLRYSHPVSGYAPLVEPVGDELQVAGYQFRGSIRLRPGISGTLLTNTAKQVAEPMIIENYLRLITAYAALASGGVLMHSAGVVVEDKSLLFLGRSGAGKTTISRLAMKAGCDILSDDGNLLLPDGRGGFRAGPVPFAGDLGQVPCRDRRSHPVAGLFWLEQADRVKLKPMGGGLAYSRIMACCPTVNVDEQQQTALDVLIRQVLAAVPVYALDFSRESDFAEIVAGIAGVV